MAIWVSCRLRDSRVRSRAIERLASRILRELGYRHVDINLTFVGNQTMRRLNRHYRRRDRTTDVLAFACQEAVHPPSRIVVLGDVVVSVPAAIRQAEAAGHTVDRELTLLLVHGILHLCGYDHERNLREARRMFRRQREILAKIDGPPRFLNRS